jgi:hypothetical protein
MITFVEFTKAADESQIDTLYSKAHIAVEIVRMYQPELLADISTIANLASGAYGVYNSGDNRKVLPPEMEKQLVYYGPVGRHNLDMIPKKTLMQYYPYLHPQQIQDSDTIHVNVRRIMQESDNDLDAILEIASTIVHECTHEKEREATGQTSEAGPVRAEEAFMGWAKQNMNNLLQRFPQLRGDVVGRKGQLPAGKV